MALLLRSILLILLTAAAAQAQEQPPAVPDLAPQMQAPAPETAAPAPALPPAAPEAVPALDAPAAPASPEPQGVQAPADAADAQEAPAPANEPETPAAAGADPAPAAFDTEAAEAPAEPGLPIPHDLTPWGMFEAAHWVVQAVMILLAAASFVTWTVLLFKLVEIAIARRRLARTAATVETSATLDEVVRRLSGRKDPAAFMARASFEELQRSDAALDLAGTAGLKERVRSILERVEAQAGERLRRGIGLLATIGSVGPFVGLFGTVWGIMNAFIGISQSQTTNLAVVAPGIAEALLATGLGLVAAIPAVVIYNHFVRSIASWRLSLADAGAAIERMLSRDLDYRSAGRS
ncbi:tonB-system energizer ExbB [Cereibacter sphaeroides]|uniref:tonB-system energizer ExbB n=1 Tax=Cereibacter sphaeroides TaxID=1063 RepID=UPI000E5B721E|nr:tonB-system energizer ExbB [Cereibacter sphaeroides]RHZ92195.1 tonB-system energizer ExbB [Cereibacter sphaeroides]